MGFCPLKDEKPTIFLIIILFFAKCYITKSFGDNVKNKGQEKRLSLPSDMK